MSDLELNLFVWKAKWIWKDAALRVNDFVFFRREYEIIKPLQSARVYVSAHNHFELFVNGTKASGYVTPAPTHPKKSKYFVCYDIGKLLKSGMNVFGATAHFIGGGGQNYVNGLPGFILQCRIGFEDGSEEIWITDESWKVQGETPFRNGTAFQQNRKMSAIEDYYARKEDDWLKYGYDDSHWGKACLSGINKEDWVLKPQSIPEGKVHEVICPTPVGTQETGLQVFDAGKIVTGWPRLDLPGVEGVRITMRYSEDLDGAGRVKHNVCNEKSENYYDTYTMKGAAKEAWEPCFSYKAFRYVEVTGYPERISPENMRIVSAGTGLTYAGFFNSSNVLLNDIYHACIQTQKNNVVGQMVDCPHREQAQYLADSDLQAETFIYNFSDSSVLEKVLFDFKDAQNNDGSFPFVFPTNIHNPEFDIKIPEWDLHYVTMLWKTYFAYGNENILQQCYEPARNMIGYYLRLQDDTTGLLPKAEGFPKGWNISDWPYPDIDETGEFLTVQNCLFYHVLGLMVRIASLLGFEDDGAKFVHHAAVLKESIIKNLYQPDKKRFADCYGSEQGHQGTQVVAYQYGLVPEKDRDTVLEHIVESGFGCSTLLSLNLLQVLFENGKGREAYSLLNRTEQPGWGHMIAKGYKTIWEGFQDIESHSHAWNAYPARIFAEYLTGIKATAPGFKEIDIRPYIPSDMLYAEAKVPTIWGSVYVRWDLEGNDVTLKIRIPAGVVALVFLPVPDGDPKIISEMGEYVYKVIRAVQ
jgi:alpha-L-rhamnosidase